MILSGKNAIITGARTGIGLATLELFVQNGANVWAVVHREDTQFLTHIQELATTYHVWIVPVYIDLSSEESIKDGVKQIYSTKEPVDILVNAAGVVSPNRLISMTTLSEMQRVMQVNFWAAVQMSQFAFRVMSRRKSGNIINIASISGIDSDYAQLEYCASKAALISSTKKMAYEFGSSGIRVNAVAPGVTDTNIVRKLDADTTDTLVKHTIISRKALPLEIAQTCLFLASDKTSSYITGQVIRVDGGGVKLNFNVEK